MLGNQHGLSLKKEQNDVSGKVIVLMVVFGILRFQGNRENIM